jgi:hypothetical protein
MQSGKGNHMKTYPFEIKVEKTVFGTVRIWLNKEAPEVFHEMYAEESIWGGSDKEQDGFLGYELPEIEK